nr:MAG: RNA-dependent RNA polymerase [Partitiviridae sp.]
MKLKECLKKFNFLKKLDLPDKIIISAANQLLMTIEGHSEIYYTPLAKSCDPIEALVDWDELFEANHHRMNSTLLNLELSNRDKFGPRSIAVGWAGRRASLKESFDNQNDDHVPKFFDLIGEGDLCPLSIMEASEKMKANTSAGFPFLCKKKRVKKILLDDFNYYLDRGDPCALYTRTAEQSKTRNVWGYPFADTLYEMSFYEPLLWQQRQKYYRSALVSPDLVSERVTELILKARGSSRVIYSVDFSAFDSSVKYQYIIKAFEYIASCFAPMFGPLIRDIGERFYTIPIVTPSGLYRGNHGVPSGSTFTNEVDSLVQVGIALTNNFINEMECQVQGDDGVYLMPLEAVTAFEESFKYAGLKLNSEKSRVSSEYAMYCQNLYHVDYMKEGVIGGIYPTYRAINRIMHQERFVNFSKAGIKGKDYYGIRCLSILENCKHHPLFEDLVRFVLQREKFSLDVSDDGLTAYCNALSLNYDTAVNLNHQHGSNVLGIRNFEAYKLAKKILDEPEFTSCV